MLAISRRASWRFCAIEHLKSMNLRLFPSSDARLYRPNLKCFLSLCHTISIATEQSVFSGNFNEIDRIVLVTWLFFPPFDAADLTFSSRPKLLLHSDDLHAIKQEVYRERLQLARSRLGYNESRSNEEFPRGSRK